MTRSERRVVAFCVAALVLLSGGWFMLSWQVAHNPVGDAIGEALGVALGLLIVMSVVGAIRSRGGGQTTGPDR